MDYADLPPRPDALDTLDIEGLAPRLLATVCSVDRRVTSRSRATMVCAQGRGLDARGHRADFEARLKTATWVLGASFTSASAMNYFGAARIKESPAGTPAFNEALCRLTLLSHPMIAAVAADRDGDAPVPGAQP